MAAKTGRFPMVHVEPFRIDSERYPLKVRILARHADVDPLWQIADAQRTAALPQEYRRRLEARLIAAP